MNRNKLKAYAPQARRDFIKAVTDRAAYYGLTKDKIEPITEQGDVAIIAGRAFPGAVAAKRKRLEERIRRQGFDQVMEAMAYTWFNRFVAIRFMELHGYLDHGYRVLSTTNHTNDTNERRCISRSCNDSWLPEILEYGEHVDLPGVDQDKVVELKLAGNKDEELYRMLLIAQCNALHKAIPFLFEWINDATELLLPENLLHSDSVIRKLVKEILEEDWREVEIIGWLYQFYISEKKGEVIGKVVKSEDIPAATQLFTPNWIVKYMVQNTLGRQWMATYPNSSLKQLMEFYIEPAEQTAEVQEQLNAIIPESLNPEELTLLDPACGSGHILVEAYDLLKTIYQERGYRAKDIPRLILEKNLYGLEIDDRAAQLAAFALMMKARADDRHIFENGIQPHVLAIQESKGLDAGKMTESLNEPILKVELPPREFLFEEMEEERAPLFSRKNLSVKGDINEADVAELIDLFEHGKTFGSLIHVPQELSRKLPGIMERVKDVLAYGDMFGKAVARSLRPLVEQARILAEKYDAVVTNPPYMGRKAMPSKLKQFAVQLYPDSKSDLFAMFAEMCQTLTRPVGQIGLVMPYVWMFLVTYEHFRQTLYSRVTTTSLVQLEYNAFEPACVPVCTFAMHRVSLNQYRGTYIKLSDFRGHENQASRTLEAIGTPQCPWKYHASANDFRMIPGSPVAYWLSKSMNEVFTLCDPLPTVCRPAVGLQTGDNDRFLRLWYEVDFSKIGFGLSKEEAQRVNLKWFPYNKGGIFRKWFGNNVFVVNWENNGEEIKSLVPKSVIRNEKFYFTKGVTWSALSSSNISMRAFDNGFLFDTKGQCLFLNDDSLYYEVLAYLNSKIVEKLLEALSPTLDFNSGRISVLPYLKTNREKVDTNTKALVGISKEDWDCHEVSWNFQVNPIADSNLKSEIIERSFDNWQRHCIAQIKHSQELETENNRALIETYGLQGELVPEVGDDQITLYRPNREEDIKRLISYAVGCMMGRYSIDKPGLIYARSCNEGFDSGLYKTFAADQDGIIPVTDTDWFKDDAANRMVDFIGVAWPKQYIEENLKFIAESLGSKRGESPRDTIRRYLAHGFFKDHLHMYKGPKHPPRPIYWLFGSGRQRAFQCLVYLHRYNEGTLSRMRTEYVIPLQGKINARIEQLRADIDAATSTSHRKKLERERDKLVKQHTELLTFDEKLRHYADKRISLDLDDGVKVNYGKFGDLLAEVKAVTVKKKE